jgi:ubiquinone/menaquinone biosynthesis C-methylase UbiE
VDIGCGSGAVGILLAERRPESGIVLLDISLRGRRQHPDRHRAQRPRELFQALATRSGWTPERVWLAPDGAFALHLLSC